jgi:hypothetical protein
MVEMISTPQMIGYTGFSYLYSHENRYWDFLALLDELGGFKP